MIAAMKTFTRARGILAALCRPVIVAVAGCAGGSGTLPLVSATGAVYPPDARDAGIEGYVVVRYDVDAEGRVRNARVVDAVPPGVFEESALQAVSRWRFRPPAETEGPVTGLESRLEFSLEGADRYEDY